MATAATLKQAPLQPGNWIHAGFSRLAAEGIEAVRIEVLARDLGVSKGSFYWHFQDREDLLDKMLACWEDAEVAWLDEAGYDRSAATRWAKFVERSAQQDLIRLEAAIRAWARRDERVASRVAAVEKKKARFIASVLLDVGFTTPATESWSELALLVYLGWLDRATRDCEFQLPGHGLGEFLSELVLAASSRIAGPSR